MTSVADFIVTLRQRYNCQRDKWDDLLRDKHAIARRQRMLQREVELGHSAAEWRVKELSEKSPAEIDDQALGRNATLVASFVPTATVSTMPIYFTQIWTHKLNARATRAPTGERVVLINRGCVCSFAYASLAFADVVAHAHGLGRGLETVPLVRDQPYRVTLERVRETAAVGVDLWLIGGNSGD